MPLGVRSLPPSGKVPNMNKKEWCSHWIRHGECNFTQQGCIFKHEMPDNLTLNNIGFRCVPDWYKERESRAKLAEKRRTQNLSMDGSKHTPITSTGHRARPGEAAFRMAERGIIRTPHLSKTTAVVTEFPARTVAAPALTRKRDVSSSPETAPTANGPLTPEHSLINLECDEPELLPAAIQQQIPGLQASQIPPGYVLVEHPGMLKRGAALKRPSCASSNENKATRNVSASQQAQCVIGQTAHRSCRGGGPGKSASSKE
jgi:hypothetical protein